MLGDYVRWWAEQMLQWVPERLRAGDPVAAHALILQPVRQADEDPEFDIALRRRGQDRKLGRFAVDAAGLRALQAALPARARPPATLLRLPPGLLLEREVVLPLAAEREPERVLAYEMDRLTPFAANEVFWTYAIERRDRTRGRLHVRLSVVMRDAVQPLLAALAPARLAPTLLDVPNAAGLPRRIALQLSASGRTQRMRQLRVAAGLGCAALAIAVTALPFAMQQIAEARVDRRIAALQPRVNEAEALRRRIASATAGVDVVAAERARLGDTLAVLAALTESLPDDTYLTDLTLRQGQVTMNGQSGEAVRLIAALSGDPVIRNPEFAAPVTRLNGHADSFAIRASVAP
jgi:general secretion pathway protein L